jgi:hypothetical protein
MSKDDIEFVASWLGLILFARIVLFSLGYG